MSSTLAPGLLVASPPLGDPNFDRTVILLAIHNEHGALGFVINRLAPLQIGELLGLAGYGEGLSEIRGAVYVGGPVEPSSGWVLGSRDALGLAIAVPERDTQPAVAVDAGSESRDASPRPQQRAASTEDRVEGATRSAGNAPARPAGGAPPPAPRTTGARSSGASATTRAASVASGRGGAGALVKEAVAGDGEGVIAVGDNLVVTSSRKVFDEVGRRAKDGEDPDDPRRLVLLGYAGWGPGQLEGEIARGAWIPLPLDERILFATDPAARWERMFEMLGVTTLGAASMRTVGSA